MAILPTVNWAPQTSNWQSFTIPAVPQAFTTAVGAVNTLTNSISGILNIAKTALQALSAISLVEVNLTQTAVDLAIKAINGALDSLNGSAGIYAIAIPPRRQVVIPTVVQSVMHKIGISDIPAGEVDLKFINLSLQVAQAGFDSATLNLLHKAGNATGGAGSFIHTFVQSLNDPYDINRPQLAATDAVAGLFFVGGAPDYLSLLNFSLAFDSLIGGGRPGSAVTAPDLPRPRNLKAIKQANGIQLTWDYRSSPIRIPAYGTTVNITQTAIIRSTDPEILFKDNVIDLFGTTNLTAGLTEGKHTVLATQSEVLLSYVDTTAPTDGTPCYYVASYRLKNTDGVDHEYQFISNAVKITQGSKGAGVRSGKSTPPDWVRVSSPLAVIPGFSSITDWIRSAGASFQGASVSTTSALQGYITFIGQQIDLYGGYVTQVSSVIKQLNAIGSLPLGISGGYAGFAGVGGLPYLTGTITKYATELPFAETDFVAGAVIIVTGPSHAAIQPVFAVLEMLFGVSKQEANIFKVALDSLGQQINVLSATFAENMQPGVPTAVQHAAIDCEDCCVPFSPTIPSLSF